MTIIYSDKKLRARQEKDFYPTPIELCIWSITKLPQEFKPFNILDPGAGDGVWGNAVRKKFPNSFIQGIELRDIKLPYSYNFWERRTDFITWNPPSPGYKYDLILGNPPYSLAEEFIDKSFSLLSDNGILMFLLRTAFLESKKRFYKYFCFNSIEPYRKPYMVCVSVRRVSFTGNGKSDDTSYSLFFWKKNEIDKKFDTILDWLDWNYEKN